MSFRDDDEPRTFAGDWEQFQTAAADLRDSIADALAPLFDALARLILDVNVWWYRWRYRRTGACRLYVPDRDGSCRVCRWERPTVGSDRPPRYPAT